MISVLEDHFQRRPSKNTKIVIVKVVKKLYERDVMILIYLIRKFFKMQNNKKFKIIFWVTTTIIFLFEGVLTALTSHSQMSIDGITHLGYPLYFVNILTVFKVLGAFALIIPQVPARVKEWAYAGFGFDFICAFASIAVIDGKSSIIGLVFPLIFLGILVASYLSREKLISHK